MSGGADARSVCFISSGPINSLEWTCKVLKLRDRTGVDFLLRASTPSQEQIYQMFCNLIVSVLCFHACNYIVTVPELACLKPVYP